MFLYFVQVRFDSVQAMAWCPWKQGVLATGGGSQDGLIRLWYAQSGELKEETFTDSQVYYKKMLCHDA